MTHSFGSAVLLLALWGCPPAIDQGNGSGSAIPFTEVSFSQPNGWVPGKSETYFVVTVKNWSKIYSAAPKGADLSNCVYVVAAWGPHPDSGYKIKIQHIDQVGETIQVKVQRSRPEKGMGYCTVIVHPVAVAEVNLSDLHRSGEAEFSFVEESGQQLARIRAEF